MAFVALPVLVVLLSGLPFYNPVGYIDPWLYTGYFNNLTELNQNVGWNNYYISRISWIIPGYLAYRLPSMRVAYWVLHISLCYTTLIFFYLFVKERYGKTAGVVGFALLAANPLFLMADVWEYPDGPAIMYFVAGLYFLSRTSAERASFRSTCMAGALLGSAGYCHLGIAPYVLLYVLIHLAVMLGRDWRRTAAMAFGLLAGLVAITVTYGTVSFAMLRHFSFYEPQIAAAFAAKADMINYKQHSFAWMLSSYRILVPIVLILAVAAAWTSVRKDTGTATNQYRQKLLADGLFVGVLYGSFLYSEVFSSGIYLQISYWFSFELPGICLLAAALSGFYLEPVWKGLDSLTSVLLIALGPPSVLAFPWLVGTLSTHPAVFAGLALLVLALLVWRQERLAVALPAVMILFVDGSFAMTPDVFNYYFDHNRKTAVNLAVQLGGIDMIRELHGYNLRDADFLFWASRSSPFRGGEFVSMVSLYLNRFVNNDMPKLDAKGNKLIGDLNIRTIIALAEKDEELDQAVRALDENHFHPRIAGGNRINETGWSFVYRVIRITSRSDEIIAGLVEIPGTVELRGLVPNGSASSGLEGPVRIQAVSPPWAYLASALVEFPNGSQDARIRIKATVLKGKIGFGVLNGDETKFYDRKFSGPGDVDLVLEIAHPDDTHKLIVCNGEHEGAAEVTVSTIAGFARKGGADQSTPPQQVSAATGIEISGALNLVEILPTSSAVSLESGPPLRIRTLDAQWAYAAYLPLPFVEGERETAWIRISARVLSGSAGFGILNRSEKAFYTRTTLGPTPTYKEITLKVEHPEDSLKLIIENDTPGGGKADVLVSRVSLVAARDSKIWKRLAKTP